jgi:hypothetical protein
LSLGKTKYTLSNSNYRNPPRGIIVIVLNEIVIVVTAIYLGSSAVMFASVIRPGFPTLNEPPLLSIDYAFM